MQFLLELDIEETEQMTEKIYLTLKKIGLLFMNGTAKTENSLLLKTLINLNKDCYEIKTEIYSIQGHELFW